MNDWKLIVGVVGGCLLLLVVVVVGFGRLAGEDGEVGQAVKEVQGGGRLVRGGDDAKVIVVEFSDFQCPACKAAQSLVRQVEAKEGVRLDFRQMPLSSIHKNAQIAGEAAEAAYDQGKFWEYHDLLFARQGEWSELNNPEEKLIGYAEELGLDGEKFAQALSERTFRDRVIADYQEGLRLGLRGTPTFFVNGRQVNAGGLVKTVDEELAL